ncbi:MAG: nitroreductase family protein [Thermoplasmata archaeon]
MDVLEAIRVRRSITGSKPAPISEEVVQALIRAFKLALSADNMQPGRFVLITDEERKAKVVAPAGNQKWMVDAPVLVAAMALFGRTPSLVDA